MLMSDVITTVRESETMKMMMDRSNQTQTQNHVHPSIPSIERPPKQQKRMPDDIHNTNIITGNPIRTEASTSNRSVRLPYRNGPGPPNLNISQPPQQQQQLQRQRQPQSSFQERPNPNSSNSNTNHYHERMLGGGMATATNLEYPCWQPQPGLHHQYFQGNPYHMHTHAHGHGHAPQSMVTGIPSSTPGGYYQQHNRKNQLEPYCSGSGRMAIHPEDPAALSASKQLDSRERKLPPNQRNPAKKKKYHHLLL